MSTVKIQLRRGLAGRLKTHRKIVRSLGLRKVNQIKELKSCPEVLGQIRKVEYLLRVID